MTRVVPAQSVFPAHSIVFFSFSNCASLSALWKHEKLWNFVCVGFGFRSRPVRITRTHHKTREDSPIEYPAKNLLQLFQESAFFPSQVTLVRILFYHSENLFLASANTSVVLHKNDLSFVKSTAWSQFSRCKKKYSQAVFYPAHTIRVIAQANWLSPDELL